MRRTLLLSIVILIVLIWPVNAYIGVSPPSYSVNFESGLTQEFAFRLLSDNPRQDFSISVQGDLAKYVTLDKKKLKGPGVVTARLDLPQVVETPGPHTIYIVVSEDVGNANGINIVGEMRAHINVEIPYPGKYLEANLLADSVNTGEPVQLKLEVVSKGTENANFRSKIEIFDSLNESMQTITFPQYEIAPQETKDVSYLVNTSAFLPGRYTAVATIDYDNKVLQVTKDFRLGELYINVTDYSKVYRPEAINPIYVHVESFWNEPIEDVYATIEIPGYPIPSIKTPSIKLDPWGTGELVGYFDTTPIQNKSFKAYISVVYEGMRTEKAVTLTLKPVTNYSFVFTVVVSILVIMLLVSILVWLSVRLKKLEMMSQHGRKKKE